VLGLALVLCALVAIWQGDKQPRGVILKALDDLIEFASNP
jgi:hypothetical protein